MFKNPYFEEHQRMTTISLGSRDGFTQPIFYKRFESFSLYIRQNELKKQWSAVTSLGE